MIPAAAFQELLIDSSAVLRGDAGALRGSVRELASNYHVPISNTAV